jgi:CheY-like chemotaxis protein
VYVSVAKVEGRRSRGEDRGAKIYRNTLEAASPLEFVPIEQEGWNAEVAKSNTFPFLLIKIRDTGIGIPEDQLPFVFDRFYQVDSREHRQMAKAGEGTGIGLSLCKELIKLMDGHIAVSSKIGEGTCFKIWLPIRQTRELVDTSALGLQAISAKTTSAASTEPETGVNWPNHPQVLIVDDNKDVIVYLQSCLQPIYKVETAYNGAEGINKAMEIIPDLIISDIMMPEKDGYELCSSLKQDIRTSHIPIILLTAKGDLESKIAGLKQGADAYLAKPFEEKELLIRIEQMIKLRKGLQEKYGSSMGQLGTPADNMEEQFLKHVHEAVMNNLGDENFGIAQLCRAVHLSRTHLHRKLKALTGKSASHVIREIRLRKAKELLRTTDMSISQIGYEVGFSQSAYFTKVFVEVYGQTPSDYRKASQT